MPTYTFECPQCNLRENVVRSMSDAAVVHHCNYCGVEMKQIIRGGQMVRIVRSESAFNGIGNFDIGKYEKKRYGKVGSVHSEMERWESMAADVAADKRAHIGKWGY